MDFMYLFDFVNFNANGFVSKSKIYDQNHCRSNYLYLICKYNQVLLGERAIPDFFKNDLQGVLQSAEEGKDFAKAKKIVLKHCLPEIQSIAKNSQNDEELISHLNDAVVYKDKSFNKEMKKALGNNLKIAYIITRHTGRLFDQIEMAKSQESFDRETKSKTFKNIIAYNNLTKVAEKLSQNTIKVEGLSRATA